jgi:hypothetical protein
LGLAGRVFTGGFAGVDNPPRPAFSVSIPPKAAGKVHLRDRPIRGPAPRVREEEICGSRHAAES